MERVTLDYIIQDEEEPFIMSYEEAQQLWNFIEHEYVSHEFYPLVHEMLKRLVKYVNE